MSYARKGEDGSDVYLVKRADGWVCFSCAIEGPEQDLLIESMADLIAHLKEHRDRAEHIPDHVFARLFCELFGIPFKTYVERALDDLQR